VIQTEPERMEALWENTAYAFRCIKEIGFDTGSSETPILPIYIRDNFLTFQFTQRLFEEGVFVNPVVSPAVASDNSLIRMSIMATHTRQQLDEAFGKIEKVASELQVFALKN
jgi:8-amino-7-oxononanoate synthase